MQRTTLPARAYTDSDWFEAEMEHIFASMWLAAGRTDDLPAPGRFLRRDIAGASILIVCDERGDCAGASQRLPASRDAALQR